MLANASSVLRNLLFFWKSFPDNGQNTRSLPATAAGFAAQQYRLPLWDAETDILQCAVRHGVFIGIAYIFDLDHLTVLSPLQI